MKKGPRQGGKGVDKRTEKEYNIEKVNKQVSPSGMASASQADSGGFDSRHLLQKSTSRDKWLVDFTYYLFTLHFSLKIGLSIFESKK